MIKLLRVDERLIHGQVAFAWTNSLKADCILIVNDAVAADKLRSNSLKMAAPAGVKFVVKTLKDAIPLLNGTKTDKYKLFLIVDNTSDALELVKNVKAVDHVNLGNMKLTSERTMITPSLAVSEKRKNRFMRWLRQVQKLNVELFLQIKSHGRKFNLNRYSSKKEGISC